MKHLYANSVVDWFAADTKEQAVEAARKHYAENEYDRSEWDLDFTQEPDDKVLSCYCEDAPEGEDPHIRRTAAEWAAGWPEPDLVFSTEW